MRLKMKIASALYLLLIAINQLAIADENKAQEVVFDRNKGNCLACHALPNDKAAKSPGNIGPALMEMKSRYPDRAKLRAQIWDATARNPNTAMPPFGKNKILTEEEIDMAVDYILKQ